MYHLNDNIKNITFNDDVLVLVFSHGNSELVMGEQANIYMCYLDMELKFNLVAAGRHTQHRL